MANWAEQVFAPTEAVYRENVLQDTWGHLAPTKNKTYKGVLLVTHPYYGNSGPVIVDMKFDGLDDSPWLYDAMKDFLWDNRETIKDGGAHVVNATFRNYRIWAKVTKSITL